MSRSPLFRYWQRIDQYLPFCGMIFFLLWMSVFQSPVLAEEGAKKYRIMIVSSYHREYLWSQSTNRGVLAAMLHYGYLDNRQQATDFTRLDQVESSRVILRKLWMDTKRFGDISDIALTTARVMKELGQFKPDLVMLGDDNATNYIGNQLLDTDTPVVFWGVNGLPLKYGLIDSMDRPGHNVTGVWQAGYYKEGLDLLHKLVPEAKTFAILASDSITARSSIRQLQALHKRGKLALELVAVVNTNDFEEFKRRTRQLEQQVDAFFVLNHDTMKNAQGEHMDMLEVGRWYLENIRKPEASHEDQFVREGMLLTANDSGFNQGYTAVEMVYDILDQGIKPQSIRTKTPPHGPLMVNLNRAEALGISVNAFDGLIDEFIGSSAALEN